MTMPTSTSRGGPGVVGSYATRKAQKRKYAEAVAKASAKTKAKTRKKKRDKSTNPV